MDYTQSIGNVVELQCISKFIEMGFQCSIPYGNSAKYDFIVELSNGELIRVQCKSSTWERKNVEEYSAFSFSCITSTTNTKKTVRHKYTNQEIDYFATHFQNQVYIVPVDECSTKKILRFKPPKNGSKNYTKAEDYTIEKIFGYLQNNNFSQQLKEHDIQITTYNSSKEYHCSICDTPIRKKEGICQICSHLQSRKVERPNREELKRMIRTTSFITIGKTYGVSDNAIRKWCKAENLPYKSKEIKSYSEEDWINI